MVGIHKDLQELEVFSLSEKQPLHNEILKI